MSLDWNVSKVDPAFAFSEWDSETGKGKLDPIMHALIWATMAVGLRGITDANAEEFAARLAILQHLDGAWMIGPQGEDVMITREDVLARVGLGTNVSDESRAKWSARIMKSRFVEADRAAKRAAQAKVSAAKQSLKPMPSEAERVALHAKAKAERDGRIAKAKAAGHTVG